jgi:hypothetical protein
MGNQIKHKRKAKTFLQDMDLEIPLMKAVVYLNENKPEGSERISMNTIINEALRKHLKAMKVI